MANRSPEQDLINSFIRELQTNEDKNLRIYLIINTSCKSRKYADVEYISKSGQHWVIEAKTNDSSDAHNTAHKIFGELLKETGKENRNNCKYGILIPEDSITFYSRLFQEIKREKYIGYGELIPVENVFLYGASGIKNISWEELFNSYKKPNK